MALICLSGDALSWHTRIFGARGRLQDVKEIEAYRLLDLHGSAFCSVFSDVPDPDIAAPPEILHLLLLRGEQLLEPLGHYAIQCPLGTTAELFRRSHRRSVVDHVFGEMDRTVGPRIDGEGDLAKILGIGDLMGVRARGVE